jgi:leader peptidase (prepilin peptidase)/N-methyltransferase
MLAVSFLFYLAAFIAGLLFGFAVNVIATRLAANRPLIGPLHCTRSPHPISFLHALPLVGYLAQRGTCTTCGKRLSLSYPAVELLTGGLFTALLWFEGFGLPFLFHAAYAVVLLLVLVVDWKHRDIYFSVIIVGSIAALVGSLVLPEVSLGSALVGAAVAGGFFLFAYLLARLIFPRIDEPLGSGDVLLALMMGLMLGFPNVVGALLIGPLLAGAAAILLLLSRRRTMKDFIPYGVALCAAAILFLVYPGPFVEALNLRALVRVVSNIFGPS